MKQKKGGTVRCRLFRVTDDPQQSDGNDVLRLRAFLTLRDGEFDPLAFCQRLEAVALDVAEVSKYIGTGFLLDEAEAF